MQQWTSPPAVQRRNQRFRRRTSWCVVRVVVRGSLPNERCVSTPDWRRSVPRSVWLTEDRRNARSRDERRRVLTQRRYGATKKVKDHQLQIFFVAPLRRCVRKPFFGPMLPAPREWLYLYLSSTTRSIPPRRRRSATTTLGGMNRCARSRC